MLLGALLLLSSYFSASETALTSANRLRLRNQAENNNRKAKRSLTLIERYDQTLSTILVGNNIVNIAMASIATSFATRMYGTQGSTVFLTTLIITAFVLVFGEILPKSLAKQFADKYLLHASASLMIILKICSPLTWLFVKLKEGINGVFGSGKEEPAVTDDDVKALVEMGEEEGVFLTAEKELLHKAIEFDDIVVKNILTPRPDVVAVSVDTPIDEVKDVFIQEKYSRLPVYDGTIDNVVGVIYHRDFFTHYVMDQDGFTLETIMRKPHFVIGSAKISILLEELQKNKVHLAIVLDEFGGTLGIVSMEDIIEEIFGEILDEHDENEVLIEQIDHEKLLINGRYPIEEFSELVNSELPETSSVTLSGWISETLGYLPKKGESLEYDHFNLYIEEVRNRRIQKVILQLSEKQTA